MAEGTPEELTEMNQSTQEVKLRVKGAKSAIETVLKGMKHVHRQEFSVSDEEGTVDVLVFAQKEKDIREELFKEFAKNELPILSMSAYVKSLEDIFLEVTDNNTDKSMGKVQTKKAEKIEKEIEEKEESEEES